MPIETMPEGKTNVLHLRLTGKLDRNDYLRCVPRIEAMIQEHGKLRVLVEMEDFHGWDAPALWEDIKFDARHFNDVKRVAMVGEKAWQKWMATFCKPFTTAKVKYFEQPQVEEAREWVTQE